MHCLEDKLFGDIRRFKLLAGVKRLLLAVSGGADSVAMAHALSLLSKTQKLGCELSIGHVNHCLRGSESDSDEQFVKKLAQDLGVAYLSTRINVRDYAASHRLSIETAARMQRHNALINHCKELNCNAVATAHHADDQAETIIHRLIRGTGFRGLCGIRNVSIMHGTKFIRPMLSLSRQEIDDYCTRNQLTWRQDSTNLEIEYTRNRIRHCLMPLLVKGWPSLQEGLSKLARDCGQMQHRVEIHAQAVFTKCIATRRPDSISLHRNVLAECPPWILYEVIRETLIQIGAGLRDYTQSHFDAIYQQVQKGSGRRQFPGGIRVRAKSKTITFEHDNTCNLSKA